MNAEYHMLHYLYEFEVMLPQQLADLLNYSTKTVYNKLGQLRQRGKVRSVDASMYKRGVKAFYLSTNEAKNVAKSRNELYLFKESEWGMPPGDLLNTILANQFFCDLIKVCRPIPGAGLIEWIGSRTFMAENIKDQKGIPIIKGYTDFRNKEQRRDVFLNILIGKESLRVVRDMLIMHYEAIQQMFPSESSRVLLLFLCLNERSVNNVLELASDLVEDSRFPFIAAVQAQTLFSKGVLAPVWKSRDKQISLLDMPYKNMEVVQDEKLLGKRKVKKFPYPDPDGLGVIR